MKEPSVGGDEMTECAASLTEDLINGQTFEFHYGTRLIYSFQFRKMSITKEQAHSPGKMR